MSGNVAVIYAGNLGMVADAFGEAARGIAADVRLLRLVADDGGSEDAPGQLAGLVDLEWADGIAFGTPVGDGAPAPVLMRFIESTEPLWSSGRLYQKAVTVFTDEPEQVAPDSVLHPIYDALYRWGAVIVGPRAFELELEGRPQALGRASGLSAARLRSAQYRAGRLARLAGVLAAERTRRARFEL